MLPTSPCSTQPLPVPPHLSMSLHTSPCPITPLPVRPQLSLSLHTCSHLSPPLAVPFHLSLTLPTSPCPSLPLPGPPYLSLSISTIYNSVINVTRIFPCVERAFSSMIILAAPQKTSKNEILHFPGAITHRLSTHKPPICFH